jgi:hypothetical protein
MSENIQRLNMSHKPPATAAADPPELPPAERHSSMVCRLGQNPCGLTTRPWSEDVLAEL